jgi:spermidine synthase
MAVLPRFVSLPDLRFLLGFLSAGWAFSWFRLLYAHTALPLWITAVLAATAALGWWLGGALRRLPPVALWWMASAGALLPWILLTRYETLPIALYRALGESHVAAAAALAFLATFVSWVLLGAVLRGAMEEPPFLCRAWAGGVMTFALAASFLGFYAVWPWLAVYSVLGAAAGVAAVGASKERAALPITGGEAAHLPARPLDEALMWALGAAYVLAVHRQFSMQMDGLGAAALSMGAAVAFWAVVAARIPTEIQKAPLTAFGASVGLLGLILSPLLDAPPRIAQAAPWLVWVLPFAVAVVLTAPVAWLRSGLSRVRTKGAVVLGGILLGALGGYALAALLSYPKHMFVLFVAGTLLGLMREIRPPAVSLNRVVLGWSAAILLAVLVFWALPEAPSRYLVPVVRSDTTPISTPVRDESTALPGRPLDDRGEYTYTVGFDAKHHVVLLVSNGAFETVRTQALGGRLLAAALLAFFHPNAQAVLHLDEGMGYEMRGLGLNINLETVDVVARSRRFLPYARRESAEPFRWGIRHPAIRYRVAPGRFALHGGDVEAYDVVWHKAVEPWNETELYHSFQFLTALKDRLTPQGIVATRIDTAYVGPDLMGALLKTYASVFPRLQVWAFDERAVYLLASQSGLIPEAGRFFVPFRLQTTPARFLRTYGIDDPREFLFGYLGDEKLLETVSAFREATALSEGSGRLSRLLPRAWTENNPALGPSLFISSEPVRISIPDLEVSYMDEVVFFDMPLVVKPKTAWQVTSVGYEFRTVTAEPLRRSMHAMLQLQSEDRLRSITVWEEFRESELVTLEHIARNMNVGEELGHGQGAITDHPLRWVLSKGKDLFALSWAWYCPENEKFFAGRFEDQLLPEGNWEDMRRVVLEQVSCFHSPAGEPGQQPGKPQEQPGEPRQQPGRP